ncbi:MAG: hypothetical protein ACTTJ6_07330 [Treponema sp.]
MKYLVNKLFYLFLFMLFTSTIFAQKVDRTPEPYGIDEFTTWQKDLRRFEILSFGALPFVSLLSFWGYDMIRAAKNPGNVAYYPWPLKRADIAAPLTEKEQKNVFFTAMGLSVGVALIDYTARAIMRRIKQKKLEAEMQEEASAIELIPLDDEMIDEKGMLKEEAIEST